jgi:LSD1 subclass zinc finger protein
MVLYGQLVCDGCQRVLSYPLGSVSCRCRNCNTINPSQSLCITCQGCRSKVLLPINTLQGLCPCCCTVIHIPVELLPMVPEIKTSADDDSMSVTVYVENPTTIVDGKSYSSVGVGTKIM